MHNNEKKVKIPRVRLTTLIKYNMRRELRSKESIFWLLMFPIILSILFYAGLSDILKGESFEKVKIAVVNDDNYNNEMVFPEIIKSVSSDNEESANNDTLFITQYTDSNKAAKLLESGKIAAYIYFDNGANLVIKNNGVGQTIVKKFLDITTQKSNMITDMIASNNGVVPDDINVIMNDTTQYIVDDTKGENEPDASVVYFYTILGMACMYGATSGCYGILYVQSNQSPLAARNCVAPVSKLKLLMANFITNAILGNVIILLILGFISCVLKVKFGNRYGYIVLTSIVGSYTGLSIGYFIGAVSKKGIKFKSNMVIAFSMMCSFMAGMMVSSVKYMIKQHAYIIDRLNPVNLITESYYKLYYYTSLDKYFENIAILCVMTVGFTAAALLVLLLQERNKSDKKSNDMKGVSMAD